MTILSNRTLNARTLAKAGILLAISQIILWICVHFSERSARPVQMDQRAQVEFIVLDAKGEPMFFGKRFIAKPAGNQGFYAPLVVGSASSRFLIPFQVSSIDKPLGLFLSIRSDLENIRINGQLIQAALPTERQMGDVNNEPAFFSLPPSALKPGENLLTLEAASVGAVHDLGQFAIGDASELYSSYRWKMLLVVDLAFAGVAILLFAALLCLVVNWPEEDRPRIRSLIILLLINAATTTLLTLSPQADMPLWVTVGTYAASSFATGLAILQYAMRDSDIRVLPERWYNWAWLAIPFVVGLAMLVVHLVPEWMGFGFTWTVKLSFYFEILLGTVGSFLLAWAAAAQKLRLFAERLVLILCFSFFSLDRVASMLPLHSLFDARLPLTLPWTPITGVFLGMAIVLSIAREASEARRTVVRANEILAARLTEQDAELARSYDAQKQMLQRQVMLEERQRIVRDMHDGIGGQLLGLMMQVRSGGFEARQVEEGLQSSIADLRLIVDSMDSAEDGLAETLRAFEHRVRAQVEAAGMAFAVEHGLPEGAPGPGPRPTLQILRVLQEGVTNAMRHSGAATIRLASAPLDDATIRITLADDGKGLPPDIKGGRGLTNMRTRAKALGGHLEIETGAHGTRLVLTLPRTA